MIKNGRKKNIPFVFTDLYSFEDFGSGIKRKILAYGDALMQVEAHFEEGSIGVMHSHLYLIDME